VAADPPDPSGLREQIAENQRAIDRLNRDLVKKSTEVQIIQQISSEITSTLDLDEVLGIVLRAMERVLGFAHSMILSFAKTRPADNKWLIFRQSGETLRP
jgi:adenylate cyclase